MNPLNALRHARGRIASLMPLAGVLAACALPPVPPTTEHDASLPAVTLTGYRFHAQTFGNPGRPVLIVLHGGPGMDYRYLLGLQALADEYQVVFYDQRGSGLSPRVPAQQITLDAFVNDLDAFVDHYGQGRPVHLLGHSWGAMLASAYTGLHPAKVGRLVLAEPGFLDASTLDAIEGSGWPGWRVVWGFTWAWIGKWFTPTGSDPYARDDAFLLQVLPLTQGQDELCDGRLPPLQAWRAGYPAFQATMGRAMADPAWARQLNFRQGVASFAGPTLFLTGACNTTQTEALRSAHMAHFAHPQLAVVPQAGHFMFNDQPDRSLMIVRAFLGLR
jgi:proline iminopeptidase